jgi:hypothetical protein
MVRLLPGADQDIPLALRLLSPPPEGHVHALAVLGDAKLTFDAPVDAKRVEQLDADDAKRDAQAQAIEDLLDRAEPEIHRLAPTVMAPGADLVCAVAAPTNPLLKGAPEFSGEARVRALVAGVFVWVTSPEKLVAVLRWPRSDARDALRGLKRPAGEGRLRIAVLHAGEMTTLRVPPPPPPKGTPPSDAA